MQPCILFLLFWQEASIIINVLDSGDERKTASIISLLIRSVGLTFYIAAWALGKRCRKYSSHLNLVMFMISIAVQAITTKAFVSLAELDTIEPEDFRDYSGIDLCLFCQFLSPSIEFTLLYIVTYYIGIISTTVSWR